MMMQDVEEKATKFLAAVLTKVQKRLDSDSHEFEYNALKLFQAAVGSLSRGSAIRNEIESRIDYFYDKFTQLFQLNFNVEEKKAPEEVAHDANVQQSIHYSVPSQLWLILSPESIVLSKLILSALKTIRYHLGSLTNKSISLCRAVHGLATLFAKTDLSILAAEEKGEMEAISKLAQFKLGLGLGAELPCWTYHFLLAFSFSELRQSKSSLKLRRLLSLYSADRPVQLVVLACMLRVLNLDQARQHGEAVTGGIFSHDFDLSWSDTDGSSSSLLLHVLGLLTLSTSEPFRHRVAQSLLQFSQRLKRTQEADEQSWPAQWVGYVFDGLEAVIRSGEEETSVQQDLLRTLDLLRVSTVDFASQQKPGDELGLTQLLIHHIATTHSDDFDSLVRHAVLAVVQEELRPLLRPPLGQVAPRPEGKEEGQGQGAQEVEEAVEEGNDDKEDEEEVEEDREVETSMNYSSIYPYDGDEIVSMQFSVDMKGDPSVLAYLNSQEASQQQQEEEEDKQQPVPEPEPEEVEQTVSSIRKKRKSTAAAITSPVSTRSARKKKNL